MRHLFKKENGEEHNFWMSYTDLLSGFLIVFIIATIIYQHTSNQFDEFNSKLRERGYTIADADKMLSDYEGKMININNEFKDVFKQIDSNCYRFDSSECSIRLYPPEGYMFFKTDSSNMQPILKSLILSIGKPFVKKAIELREKYPNMEIRIEGHTDTVGSFLHNLELSSKRAYSVYECIHECGLTSVERKFVEQIMISVGYSYAKPLNKRGELVPFESNDMDKTTSRRIEFRIISK